MKTKRKVISRKSMPINLPFWSTITAGLLMDRLGAPGWVWGAVGLFFVLMWIVAVISLFEQESVDLFDQGVATDSRQGRVVYHPPPPFTYEGFDIGADGRVTHAKARGR